VTDAYKESAGGEMADDVVTITKKTQKNSWI